MMNRNPVLSMLCVGVKGALEPLFVTALNMAELNCLRSFWARFFGLEFRSIMSSNRWID